MADTTYDYFYGTQAEQFTFYRLPKVLITDPRFRKVSSDAKILYGVMLERMSLSMKNQWIDDYNRVYIIFTLEDIMDTFACGERKAGYLLSELDSKTGVGLVEKKRQGLGKPNLLYLKNFILKEESSVVEVQVQSGKILQVCENIESENEENNYFEESLSSVDSVKTGQEKRENYQSGKILQVKNCKKQPFENDKKEIILFEEGIKSPNGGVSRVQSDKTVQIQSENMQVQSGKNVRIKSGKNVQVQSGKNVRIKSGKNVQVQSGTNVQVKSGKILPVNNINNNNTEMSKKESIYPSIRSTPEEISACREMIKENIGYDYIRSDCMWKEEEYLDELVELMVETVCIVEDPIKIGGKLYPYEIVKQRILDLQESHIRYILNSLHDNRTKVRNIRGYLLTSLMNASLTISHAYQAEVNFDLNNPNVNQG